MDQDYCHAVSLCTRRVANRFSSNFDALSTRRYHVGARVEAPDNCYRNPHDDNGATDRSRLSDGNRRGRSNNNANNYSNHLCRARTTDGDAARSRFTISDTRSNANPGASSNSHSTTGRTLGRGCCANDCSGDIRGNRNGDREQFRKYPSRNRLDPDSTCHSNGGNGTYTSGVG